MSQNYWVFRRGGSKRYTFAWAPDPNQKSKRRQVLLPETLRTKREADQYAEAHEAELKSASPGTPRSSGPTLADLADKWSKLRVGDERLASATFQDAQSHVKKWIKPTLGTKTAGELDVPALRAWMRELRVAVTTTKTGKSRVIAPYTARNVLRTLTWMLDDVIGEGWAVFAGGNPARAEAVRSELPELAPRAGKSQKLRVRDVSLAQATLDHPRIPLDRRARYALVFTSGLRDGEVAGLTLADVDLEAGTVRVGKAVQLKHRDGHAKMGKTKTRDSLRVIPLHSAARDALKEWLGMWPRLVGRPSKPEDPIFPNASGGFYRPRSAELFRVDAAKANLPTQVDGFPMTFHALRRSFASWLKAAGVPAEARQTLLGHVPKTAEERHYSEEDIGLLAGFVGRIGLVWHRVQATADP